MRTLALVPMVAVVATTSSVLGVQPATAETPTDENPARSAVSRQLRVTAAERQARWGVSVRPSELRVISGPDGDPSGTWVIPRGESVPHIRRRTTSMSMTMAVTPSRGHRVREVARAWGVPNPQVAWQPAVCRSRWDQAVGWFDTCGQFGRVVRTGDRRRHWVYRQYGTCRSHNGFRLTSCRLGTDRGRTGPRLAWDDWSPRSDSDGSCRDVSLTINVVGLGIGGGFAACETIDVRKFSRPGHLVVTWRGWASRTDREVASQIGFSTPPRRLPVLVARWSLAGVVAL